MNEILGMISWWMWILIGIVIFSGIGLFILEYLYDKDFQKWRESVDKRLNKIQRRVN